MLTQVLRNTEWRELGDFVSPALLKVMPASAAWRVLGQLRRNRQDRHLRQSATEERRKRLHGTRIAVTLGSAAIDREPSKHDRSPFRAPTWQAQSVVELYFHQLFEGDLTLLDLRPRAFSALPDQLAWHPAAWIWQWEPGFLASLRRIYRGFYEDDDRGFRQGLSELSLAPAESIFRKHFGADQARVSFRTKDFVSTFHDVFVCCRSHQVRLAPSFLPLGLYLATLYEHLESLGVPVDVRAAFSHVVPSARGPRAWN